MGIGFTVDTPLKVSQYGIDSVIPIGDDILLEKLRKMYCEKFHLEYEAIPDDAADHRARRITSYLNLINDLARKQFQEFKEHILEKGSGLKKYLDLLPSQSAIKEKAMSLLSGSFDLEEAKEWLRENLQMGSLDVNIMTKVDKDNYYKGEKLPVEYNDAHAALRGYANSNLRSSIIFSAGMNPRLYSYLERFEDFYPDESGQFQKKIVLKVSDYRSALIQGKFLAKKGLWVSEYRVESGLNCGGHAFATDGYLMGPILAEFRDKREELVQAVHEVFVKGMAAKGSTLPETAFPIKITAQGGVGTAAEHQFLLEHYQVDSVGWGTPFLLVPEVTTVDDQTLSNLVDAKEDDLYLSNVSPLGVPFHNLRGNTKDMEKEGLIDKGRPGSSCPKKFLSLNTEFTEKSICTASRQYQHLKLKQLDEADLPPEKYQVEYKKVVEKACICVGLGTSALLVNGIDTKVEGKGVAICPGPNLAYFSRIMTLQEMVSHIYGRGDVISRTDRRHMFINELKLYIDFLKDKIAEEQDALTNRRRTYFATFAENLLQGIHYYQELFQAEEGLFQELKRDILCQLQAGMESVELLKQEVEELALAEAKPA